MGDTALVVAPELIRLIQDLVRIDSVNPALDPRHPGEAQIAEYVARWAQQRGLEVEYLEGRPGRPSVVVTARGTGGGRTLLLNAHLDTVGVAGMDAAFEPEIRDGRMYGRGVMDMKASVAACLMATAYAASQRPKGDVIFTAVADEEHGSIGTEETLAHLKAKGTRVDGAIVTEPTDLDLHVAHRGFAVFEVAIAGKASHTSQPEAGVNAVTHLGRLLGAVERLDDELRSRPAHPLLAHGHMKPVLVSGGEELFTTPASASATLERRTLPGESTPSVEAELRAVLDTLAAEDHTFAARFRTVVAREPFEAPMASDLETMLVDAIASERGETPMRLGAPYWTDAALVAAAGIPTVLFGPTGGGIHQPTEWLDVESAQVFERVLRRVVMDFAG